MTEVSVIVPLYNADRDYLRKCMDSALSQTLKSIEVIAVNDGSTNGCEEVLKEYAGDERLKVFNQANAGTSAARNKGLDQAQGEYVIFLDADDFLESDCCERLCSFARENEDCDIIFFGYATEYTNTRVRRVLDKNIFETSDWDSLWQRDALEMAILKGDRRLGTTEIGSPWGKLIKRSAIEDGRVRYTPGLIKGQDTVFVLNLIEKCSGFKYCEYAGYHYRISNSSISHRYNPDIINIMEKTLGAYEEFVKGFNKGAIFEQAVRSKYYRVLTGEYLELYFVNSKNTLPEQERRKEFLSLLHRREYSEAVKAAEGMSHSFFDRLIYRALVRGKAGEVFTLKRAELFARRLVVRQYR